MDERDLKQLVGRELCIAAEHQGRGGILLTFEGGLELSVAYAPSDGNFTVSRPLPMFPPGMAPDYELPCLPNKHHQFAGGPVCVHCGQARPRETVSGGKQT